MKKKILALAVILAMIVGATNIAMAAQTDGSIVFKDGNVIIKPPPEDPDGPGDPGGTDYENFFFTHNVAKNLYFGTHDLTVFGKFDSAQPINNPELDESDYATTEVGMYTGAEVINQTGTATSISVSISEFMVGTAPSLAGATFELVKEAVIAEGAGPGVGTGYEMPEKVSLMPGGAVAKAITVDSGREVKAAWYGVLTTLPGSAAPGTAQATLTWTAGNVA